MRTDWLTLRRFIILTVITAVAIYVIAYAEALVYYSENIFRIGAFIERYRRKIEIVFSGLKAYAICKYIENSIKIFIR